MPNSLHSPDEFVEALKRAGQAGLPVQIMHLAGGGHASIFTGRVERVVDSESRCWIQRDDEETPRSFWIRYLFKVIANDGTETINRVAMSRHLEVLEERKQREADGQRVLTDPGFVPKPTLVTSTLRGRATGTINGQPRDFYVFRATTGYDPQQAIIYARDEGAAVRCMKLLDTQNSTWDFFATFLQAHFFWPAWLTLRRAAQAKAREARADRPILPPGAGWDQRREREALYASCGLTEENYGPTAYLTSLEGEEINFASLFQMADRVPATLLNLYLIVAWNSMQFFNSIDRVDDNTLRQFMHHDLAAELPEPTVDGALEVMSIANLRELVTLAGSGFKARTSSVLREHLRSCMTPQLATEVQRRVKRLKYQLLPPPNWTWEQFQFLRGDYRDMLAALSQWLFNGHCPPEAAKLFAALI